MVVPYHGQAKHLKHEKHFPKMERDIYKDGSAKTTQTIDIRMEVYRKHRELHK